MNPLHDLTKNIHQGLSATKVAWLSSSMTFGIIVCVVPTIVEPRTFPFERVNVLPVNVIEYSRRYFGITIEPLIL